MIPPLVLPSHKIQAAVKELLVPTAQRGKQGSWRTERETAEDAFCLVLTLQHCHSWIRERNKQKVINWAPRWLQPLCYLNHLHSVNTKLACSKCRTANVSMKSAQCLWFCADSGDRNGLSMRNLFHILLATTNAFKTQFCPCPCAREKAEASEIWAKHQDQKQQLRSRGRPWTYCPALYASAVQANPAVTARGVTSLQQPWSN